MNGKTMFKFQLYVAGDTQNSAEAIANLGAICRAYLPDQHQIEVVDVFREPKRALKDAVFMTPMLVRREPFPVKKIVGTLSQTQTVMQTLGLETCAA